MSSELPPWELQQSDVFDVQLRYLRLLEEQYILKAQWSLLDQALMSRDVPPAATSTSSEDVGNVPLFSIEGDKMRLVQEEIGLVNKDIEVLTKALGKCSALLARTHEGI